MADSATKYHSINGGNIHTDLKSLFSLLKTRKTVTFIYGFMFVFVAVTAFLAYAPPSNSSSPWFSNIFTISTGSFRSPWFTNSTSSSSSNNQVNGSFSLSSQNTSRSNSSSTNNEVKNPVPTVQNPTQIASDSVEPSSIQSLNSSILNKVPQNHTLGIVNSGKDQTLKQNQTSISTPVISKPANQTANSSSTQVPTNPVSSGKQVIKTKDSNHSASLVKKQSHGAKQSNETKPVSSRDQELETLVPNLMNCDLFDGEWIYDDSYPLYKPGSCSLIDEQFNCIINGRPDKNYQKYKWKPKGCSIPRLNPANMLNMLRGKRLVFVGDSLNRNMWESLVCMLKGSVKDQSKVFEANGRHHFRGEASYSFIFKDYNCTVEFFVSPFLVQECEVSDKNGTKKETLRLDLVGRSSYQYKDADIIVFNTGHWWTHEKTSKGKDYYQEGSHVYEELNVLEAFRKAITTWARWVDQNVNPMKTFVLFRGYSHSHFSGGQWNSGGACDSEVEPIKNATYLREYEPKMVVLEKVLKGMKTRVTYMNITQMTDYRKDGHPSIYRKQQVTSPEERKSPLLYQDCSHWCLPGVPDAWNEILYAEILLSDYQKRQVQKRHR